jgi:hypothetical protein
MFPKIKAVAGMTTKFDDLSEANLFIENVGEPNKKGRPLLAALELFQSIPSYG